MEKETRLSKLTNLYMDVYDNVDDALSCIDRVYKFSSEEDQKILDLLRVDLVTKYDNGGRIAVIAEYKRLFKEPKKKEKKEIE